MHLPPWDTGLFPSLGLPCEKRTEHSLWSGDPAEIKGGSSVQVTWDTQRGWFVIRLYFGFEAMNWGLITEVPDLFTVLALVADHFEKHPMITQGGNE